MADIQSLGRDFEAFVKTLAIIVVCIFVFLFVSLVIAVACATEKSDENQQLKDRIRVLETEGKNIEIPNKEGEPKYE